VSPGVPHHRRLIGRRLIGRRLIDRRLIDRRLIDRRLIDLLLIDPSRAGRPSSGPLWRATRRRHPHAVERPVATDLGQRNAGGAHAVESRTRFAFVNSLSTRGYPGERAVHGRGDRDR
jgi:hypothetical protein